MKKRILTIAVAALVLTSLTGCIYTKEDLLEAREAAYDDGYNAGYTDGYSDYPLENDDWDDGYEIGIDSGRSDGYDEGYADAREEFYWEYIPELLESFACSVEEEARDYAIEHGGWHPEEAWMIIDHFRGIEPFGDDLTWQDYEDAIDSLLAFYDYFYSGYSIDHAEERSDDFSW